MTVQKLVPVLGAAVTTFLLAGAATIEVLTATMGGDIGPGIVGVFAGLLAGVVVGVAVASRWPRLGPRGRAVTLGYAVFGLALLFLALLSYVNLPVIAPHLSLRSNLVIAAFAAIAIGFKVWRRGALARV